VERPDCCAGIRIVFIDTEEELKSWLSGDNNLPRLRVLKGIGPKTVDYCKILVGISTSAIDRHLLNFLKMAGLTPINYYEARAIINSAVPSIRPIVNMANSKRCEHKYWQQAVDQFR
jgi:hypothetical protein